MGGVKSALLKAAELRTLEVDVGDVRVRVREVSAAEFAEYGRALQSDADRGSATAMLLAACLQDEDGKPLLSVDEAMQLAQSARTSMPLINAIMEVSGFKDEKKPDAG